MLKCSDIVELSSEYVDGELPFFKRLSVMLHLFMCVQCRRYMRFFRLSISVIKSDYVPTIDEEKIDQVMKKLENEHDGLSL